MNKTWLIKVKATVYNILGGVREFGDGIPWYFEADADIKEGDKVFFYLTDSVGTSGTKYNPVDEMFKRFLFEGKIVEILETNSDKDNKYWNDIEYREKIQQENHKYANIQITKVLYDYNIRSNDVCKRIWDIKYAAKDVYELDAEMEESISKNISGS